MTEDKSIFTAEHDPRTDREKVLDRTGLTEAELWATLEKISRIDLDAFERIKKEAGIGGKSLKGAERSGKASRKERPSPEVLSAEVKEERKGTRLNQKEACTRVGKRYGVSGSTVYKDILSLR